MQEEIAPKNGEVGIPKKHWLYKIIKKCVLFVK